MSYPVALQAPPLQWIVRDSAPSILDHHRQEWRDSSISDEIVSLNLRSINGNEASQKLKSHFSYSPGWWVSGLDPLNNFAPMPWGQYKADESRRGPDGELIKYESTHGQRTRAVFLRMPDPEYWQNVIANKEPIVITEGAKKAGCVLTGGMAAVALPGIWQGCKPKEFKAAINDVIAELKPFIQPGQLFVIAFDSDGKATTREHVAQASDRLAQALNDAGATASIARWGESHGKGIDDVAKSSGLEFAIVFLKNATPWEDPREVMAADTRAELQARFKEMGQGFEVASLLPTLAPGLRAVAEAHNASESAPTLALLASLSGLVSPETYLKASSNNKARPFRTRASICVVLWGESGLAAKSEIIEQFSGPLMGMQIKAEADFKEQDKTYKRNLRNWEKQQRKTGKAADNQSIADEPEPPALRQVLITSGTTEGLMEALAENKTKGITRIYDELASFFGEMDQYKKGSGADRSTALSITSNKSDSRRLTGRKATPLQHPLASITGGIQPSKLGALLGKNPELDTDGLWGRFLWTRLANKREDILVDFDIEPMIASLHENLDSMPVMKFEFSKDASHLWEEWKVQETREVNEQQSVFLRMIVVRQRESGGRIALLAHLAEAAVQGKAPDREISRQTLEGAMKLSRFCLREAFAIFATYGISDASPEASWAAQVVEKYAGKVLTPKDVHRIALFGYDRINRVKDYEILEKFRKLCELGAAIHLESDYSEIEILKP